MRRVLYYIATEGERENIVYALIFYTQFCHLRELGSANYAEEYRQMSDAIIVTAYYIINY